jgi:formamidopyrimidine-DNA glycosylase
MYDSMKDILRFSVKIGGDSMSDFRNIYGEKGGYQECHKVYRRGGEPCFKCKNKIKRIKVGGRSAHFCPKCQKQP